MNDPQYRFAFNRAGVLVDSLRLTEENRDAFKCPSCGKDMSLVLPIQNIVNHFRHKIAAECNRETYLHNAAKRAFKQAFDFYAAHDGYYVKGKAKLKISDVFDRATLETATDGGTIPDITLLSKHGDFRKLFVEIYVTHRVNWQTALMRYYPTIEIPIRNEDDIERLKSDTLDLLANDILLYENGLDIVYFLSSPLYLTEHQFSYIERYGLQRLEDPDTSKPSLCCALLELGALDHNGTLDKPRLDAIKSAYKNKIDYPVFPEGGQQ